MAFAPQLEERRSRRRYNRAAKIRPMHTHRYVERLVDLLDPSLNRLHGLDLDEARRRVLPATRPPCGPSTARSRSSPRTASRSAWRGRSTGRCATSSPSGRRGRRCSSPTGSTRCIGARGRGARRPVPSELHADGAGAPRRRDPAGRAARIPIRSTRASSRRSARRCRPISTRSARRYIGAASLEVHKWLRHVERETPGAPIGVCFSGGIDSGSVFLLVYHAMHRGSACRRRGSRRSCSTPAGPTSRRRAPSCRRSASSCSSRRSPAIPPDLDPAETLARDRGLQAARRRVRQRRPAAVPRHPRALPGVAAPRRRRRRRREPQGLPDRGEPGADDPQRARQPDAVPGGLGRRPHQALADLQRRAGAQLRAHLRAGAALRLRRLQPATRSPASSRSRRASRSWS